MDRRQKRWWDREKDERGKELLNAFGVVKASLYAQRTDMRGYQMMYGAVNRQGSGYSQGPRWMTDGAKVRFNVASMFVDTAASRIATMRPKVRFQLEDGSWEMYRKARKIDRVISGQWEKLGIPALMRKAFFDAAIPGKGCLRGRLDPKTGEPMFERIMPASVYVDENEAIDGRSPNVYLYMPMDKADALIRWPDKKDIIDSSPEFYSSDIQQDFFLTNSTPTDTMGVIEAWHLPRGDKEGRYIAINTKGDVLEDDLWDMPRVPLCFYDWKPAQSGFWGVGICEEVIETQRQINGIMAYKQRLMQLASGVHIMAHKQAKLNPDLITNGILNVYQWEGSVKPSWEVFSAVPPDIMNEVNVLVSDKQRQLGISEVAQQGTTSKAMSGISRQLESDLNDLRHKENAQRFEDFAKDIAELLCLLNDAALDVNPDIEFPALIPGRGGDSFNRKTKWADVRIDPDDYRITCQPISSLPSSPTGRTEMIEKWMQMGTITPQDAMQQLDFPDTGETLKRALIDFDFAAWQLEQILDGDEMMEPDEVQNADVALQVARVVYMQLQMDDAPDEAIKAVKAYMDSLQVQKAQAQPPAPADPNLMGQDMQLVDPSAPTP